MMETRGSAMMDMQPMVQPLAGRWDGRRARAARVAVLALLSALGSVLLGASPALASHVSFSGPTNFAAGPGPISVAVGDFNGDSDPDLAVANRDSNSVSVLLGGAGGGFSSPTNFGVGVGVAPFSVAVGDFNGDSDPDLAVANFNSDNVSVLLSNPNHAPVAAGDSYTTDEDTPLNVAAGVLSNDTDSDGDALSAAVVSGPSHGNLALDPNGSFSYTPAPDYEGEDSFTYRASDGTANSATATVAITVRSVNDAPKAIDDAGTTPEDTPLTIPASALLGNDSAGPTNEGGQKLSIKEVSNGQNGQPVLNNDGSVTFTPAQDFNGDAYFDYTVCDDGGTASGGQNCYQATAKVTVRVSAVNDAPSFAAGTNQTVSEDSGTQSVSWATNISAGPSDESGQQLTFEVTNDNNSLFSAQPAVSASGALSFTPTANANGTATVSVTLKDDGGTDNGGQDTSATQTFTITVNAVNDVPTVAVAAGGQCGASATTGTINLTVGDVESEAGSLILSATSSNQNLVPSSGLSVGGSTASRTLTVSAAAKRSGTATITVRVSDGHSTGTVPLTVKVGTDSKDTLTGTSGADIIFGKNGNDTINALEGNDLICGGNGAGTMSGGSGDDTLDGGNGNDTLKGEDGNDILRGGQGSDRLEGGNNDDTLTGGMGTDSFSGGPGTDVTTDFNTAEGDTKDATLP